ncbi:594_t:CDS:1, partial [Gigaspora margarita]
IKTSTRVNNRKFIIRVVQQNQNNKIISSYICQTSGYICPQTGQDFGNVENDSSSAITNFYRIIFPNSCTRFLDSLMMGLDNNSILKKMILDLTFQPVIFLLEKLHIIIYTIGVSKHKDWNWAGPRYTASLTYGKDKLLYLQGFEYNKCYI